MKILQLNDVIKFTIGKNPTRIYKMYFFILFNFMLEIHRNADGQVFLKRVFGPVTAIQFRIPPFELIPNRQIISDKIETDIFHQPFAGQLIRQSISEFNIFQTQITGIPQPKS